MSRLILVSNRLPITVRAEKHRLVTSASSGGLATGLERARQRFPGSVWIGWPGDLSRIAGSARAHLDAMLAEHGCVPVPLSSAEIARFYDGFSNSVLWPLFHYLLDRIPADSQGWDAYRRVNERFADAVAANARPGDLVWVHDYQLMLVPAMLRRRLPQTKIGFFLHVPFPAAEVLRTLPWREPLLQGLLGSDLVGFHTTAYKNHFAASSRRVLGIANVGDSIRVSGRDVRLGAFPMGIDAAHFQELARDETLQTEVEVLRHDAADARILLGVDRLDYTKGMLRRLHAFERLLEREPGLRGKVRLIQVAVPSRDKVESYQQHRRELDELVGRINGAFGSVKWVPIHYVHRPLSERHLVALYRAADVMLVTPLRDGMNLVAKEFVACRTADDGVLVLSEFAGAASEMAEALLVNPYDIEALADACHRALVMPLEEQRFRMHALRGRVIHSDVHRWAQSFVDALNRVAPAPAPDGAYMSADALDELARRLAQSPKLLALLDYDGTLVSFAQAPDLAPPDDELRALLQELAARPGVDVHIVSGRRRDTLERWLGDLPVALHAEHGFWSRPRPDIQSGAAWIPLREIDMPWKMDLRALLAHFTEMSPGAIIEEKTVSIAWHFRMLEPELAATRVDEVRRAIEAHVRDLPLEIVVGEKVLEVRPVGVNKGVVAHALDLSSDGVAVLSMGNDATDEDLVRELPPSASTVLVGDHPSAARYRLEDPAAARRLLHKIASLR